MATDRDLERRFAAICNQPEKVGVDHGSPDGDRSVPVIQHRKKRWPNGPPPTHERDPDVGRMSPGTLKLESVRVTCGPHRKGRQVDLVVGARVPIQAHGGVVLAEIIAVDGGSAKPYQIRRVGGTEEAQVSSASFADHWPGVGL